jgi:outer membrane immunogenic protein
MHNKLLSSLAGAAFILAASGSAFAQAPPPPPAPVYNWTGWYAGVNAGASFGDVKTDFNAPVTISVTSLIMIIGTGTRTFGFAGSNTNYPSGFMGGGQIGYNWQLSPIWVAGLEADFQGADEREHSTLTNNLSGFVSFDGFSAGVVGSTVFDYATKIEWFGTVRPRIGYVWGDGTVMSYVTGGLAYGKVDVEGTATSSGTAGSPTFSVTQAFGHSQVNTGWVVGYGTEGVIDFWGSRNWTWKIEGLYMDLGHLDATGPGSSSTNTEPGVQITTATGQVTTHSHFTDGILRAGLNYKFY